MTNRDTIKKAVNLLLYTPPLFIALTLALCCTLTCFAMGNQVPELCCHFIALYIVAALMLVVFILVDVLVRHRFTGPATVVLSLSVFVLVFCGFKMQPLYQRYEPVPDKSDLTLVHINLWGGRNIDRESLFKQMAPEDPDVVVVSELEGSWYRTLAARLGHKYPYVSSHPYNAGVGIYSKYPILKPELRFESEKHRARLLCQLDIKGHKPVGLMLVHPCVPIMSKSRFDSRNKELTELYPSEIKTLGDEQILIGDLNCTPWSPYFDKLLDNGHLKDSERGFGYTPSWPTKMFLFIPLRPFLPIDHVLVSQGIVVKERRLLGEVGSDHLPVLVKLKLAN